MITPLDILEAREKRASLQEGLIKKYKTPLLIIRANYPGIKKNNSRTTFITEKILEEIKTIKDRKLESRIINIEKINSYEGLIFLLSLNYDPIKIKKIAIKIEEKNIIGRLVDLDVIDEKNNTISRTDLGYQPRKCFICDEVAQVCVRSQKHSLEEIIEYIENLVNQF